MTNYYKELFANQGEVAEAVSEPFRLDAYANQLEDPILRNHGTIDGGSIKLQSLDPAKNLQNADMAYDSTDWQDSDDSVGAQGNYRLLRNRMYWRLKLTGLGASADLSSKVVYYLR